MESMDHLREHCPAWAWPTAPFPSQTHAREAPPRLVDRRCWGGLPWRVVAVLAFGLAVVLPPRAHAATFACSAGNVACLIAAIHEANANGETNTITLAAGTYTLTAIENGDEFEGNGLPVITSPLTLTGAGAEVTSITRDANAPPFRILKVEATGTLTLQGLTLRGGGFTIGAEGGGIANSGTLTLIDCTLTENRAALDGGGILNRGTLRLTRTTVTRNCGDAGAGIANIAALSTNATATITDSIIADNFCARGGGRRPLQCFGDNEPHGHHRDAQSRRCWWGTLH